MQHKLAARWGVPPWTLDPSQLSPKQYRHWHYELEMMDLEAKYGR